jgi:predicted Zn-dependent protease
MASTRFERGEESLAELASAEASFTVGDYTSALNFAERARRALPRNTVDYRRADDIVNFAGNEVRERMQRTSGRRGG